MFSKVCNHRPVACGPKINFWMQNNCYKSLKPHANQTLPFWTLCRSNKLWSLIHLYCVQDIALVMINLYSAGCLILRKDLWPKILPNYHSCSSRSLVIQYWGPNFAFQLRTFPWFRINPLNAELNPIRHLLALVGARHIVHVSRIRIMIFCFILI